MLDPLRLILVWLTRHHAADVVFDKAADSAVFLRFRATGRQGMLLRYRGEAEQLALLRNLTEQLRKGRTSMEIALIGGPPSLREELGAMVPRSGPLSLTRRLWIYHVDDAGDLWVNSRARGSLLVPALEALTHPGPAQVQDAHAIEPISDDDLARVEQKLKDDAARAAADEGELNALRHVFAHRRPIATWVLLGIISSVFALEALFGGTQSTLTLARMGALVPERVYAGEWWRLFSCTFLHAGPLHFGFNVFVLWMLGSSLERILGTSRFLILYILAALGGSIASLLRLDSGISVGASGALWGLLAAEAILAFRPSGLIPHAMLDQLKRAAITNLFLNIVNSLRPQVDWAAHLGGGVAGVLLLGTGLLVRGLPRLSEVTASPDSAEVHAVRSPAWLKAVTAALCLVFATGLVLGLVQGGAWTLDDPIVLAERELPGLGIVMALPRGLAQAELMEIKDSPHPDIQTKTMTVGGLNDPLALNLSYSVLAEPLDPADLDAEVRDTRAALADAASSPPEGLLPLSKQPEQLTLSGKQALIMRYRAANGSTWQRGILIDATFFLIVDIHIWLDHPRASQNLMESVLSSVRPLEDPRGAALKP